MQSVTVTAVPDNVQVLALVSKPVVAVLLTVSDFVHETH